jgi:hypothetical protein
VGLGALEALQQRGYTALVASIFETDCFDFDMANDAS